MAHYRFGSGLLFARPVNGVGPSYAFGTLQDVSVDMSSDIKSMYGSYDTPDIAALGKLKVDIKAKFGQVSGGMFNALFYGGVRTAGMTLFVGGAAPELGTVGSSTPTYTVANATAVGLVAGSFQDLQVMYVASGLVLRNVGTATPAEGEYTFNSATGVYTFNAGDEGAGIAVSYTYSVTTAAAGTTYTRNARLMGGTLFFSLFLSQQFNGAQDNMMFYRCLCSKLSQQSKNDDFEVPEMDFTVMNNPTGPVWTHYDGNEPFVQ